ncbi:MAG: enoyl-CoA hydratase [Chitinivibrionales bacterium]|nr:enoyl-CoA hydratase [Chitinivibrionales bacterium]
MIHSPSSRGSADPPLVFERDADVGHLRLNAPPRNEMGRAFFEELSRLCRDELPNAPIAGLVVYGSGRHFSSGADVAELRSMVTAQRSERAPFLTANVEAFLALEALPYPVVAAVNGCCLGAGMELALACGYRIAGRRASFGLPESTFGLMPGCGGTIRLPALVGRGVAVQMILSGQSMLADEALAVGLVDAVVDKKELLTAAVRLIRQMSR